MEAMKPSVIVMREWNGRGVRSRRALAERRGLSPFSDPERRRRPRAGGRVWVGGHELGGTDSRHAHLGVSFD